jgi:hypothetical protein
VCRRGSTLVSLIYWKDGEIRHYQKYFRETKSDWSVFYSLMELQLSYKIFTLFTWRLLHNFMVYNVELETGFDVLTIASRKMAVFWVLAPCCLVEICRHCRGAWCLHFLRRPNDGGNKYLWNIGKLLTDYMRLKYRRQPYSNVNIIMNGELARMWMQLWTFNALSQDFHKETEENIKIFWHRVEPRNFRIQRSHSKMIS